MFDFVPYSPVDLFCIIWIWFTTVLLSFAQPLTTAPAFSLVVKLYDLESTNIFSFSPRYPFLYVLLIKLDYQSKEHAPLHRFILFTTTTLDTSRHLQYTCLSSRFSWVDPLFGGLAVWTRFFLVLGRIVYIMRLYHLRKEWFCTQHKTWFCFVLSHYDLLV